MCVEGVHVCVQRPQEDVGCPDLSFSISFSGKQISH